MPETFSSEIGDVHERNNPATSFSSEFRGASDSLIERDRPERPINVGRRGRRVLWTVVLLAVLLGGGGWAVWYWSEPIGEWIASWNRTDEPPPAPAEPSEAAIVEPPSSDSNSDEPDWFEHVEWETPPTPTPDSTPSGPTELPVERLDSELQSERLDNPSKPVSVKAGATSVRGKVTTASVNVRLTAVNEEIASCWGSAASKPGTKRPAALSLRFSIRWNGRSAAVSVTGDAPESVKSCVRSALPSSGWPQPSDGGEATVTRSWTLE